jgi:hypothetical protein
METKVEVVFRGKNLKEQIDRAKQNIAFYVQERVTGRTDGLIYLRYWKKQLLESRRAEKQKDSS